MHLSNFFRIIGLWALLLPATGHYIIAQEFPKDIYGGDSRIKGKTTGYFHIENFKGKYFLITPEGNGFFALGVNHINTVEDTKAFSATVNERFKTDKILKDLNQWNMNNCGYGCPDYLKDKVPFMVSIRFLSNGHYLSKENFGFEDVFEEDFIKRFEERIKAFTERYRDNPFLIGYYWTDTPRWDIQISRDRHGTDWVSYLKNLPAQSKGKQKFVDFLRLKYHKIDNLNKSYNVYFTSFEALLDARFDHLERDNPNIQEDDHLFLNVIAEHLYSTLYGLMKRYDPNHLILGDKYLMRDHPEGVLKAASKYVDVISIQPGPTKGPGPGQGEDELYFNKRYMDKIHQLTEKPIIICDHQTSFFTERYPVTLWHQLKTQKESAEVHYSFLKDCAERDYVIGYQRCQYIDKYDTSRGLLKQGLLKENGEEYKIFAKHLATNNKNATELKFQNTE